MPPKKYKTNPVVKKISDIKVKTKNNNKTRKLLEKVVERYKQLKTRKSSPPKSSHTNIDLGVPALPIDELLIEINKHDPTIARNDIPPIDIPEKFIPPVSSNPSTPPHYISYSDISPLNSTEYSPHTNKDYIEPIRIPPQDSILPYNVPSLTAYELINQNIFNAKQNYKGGKKKRKTRKKK